MKSSDYLFLFLVRIWCYLFKWRLILQFVRNEKTLPCPERPESIAEKFLWRKIFDHNPLFVVACDKIAAKEYVLKREPSIKTACIHWVGKDARKIPPGILSLPVVLKSNQGSGWHIMIHGVKAEQNDFYLNDLYLKSRSWLGQTYGLSKGEWAYGQVEKKLFVEEMLQVDGKPVDAEYKFHVCNGTTAYAIIMTYKPNQKSTTIVLDRDGQIYAGEMDQEIKFERMRTIAERIGKDFDFVRCDFYFLNDEIYFSELTVYPSSGFGSIQVELLVNLRNKLWDLKRSWFYNSAPSGWRKIYLRAFQRWAKTRLGGF